MPKKHWWVVFQWTQSRGCQCQGNVDEYNVLMNATQPKVDCQCQRNVDDVSMNAIKGLLVPKKRWWVIFWWTQPNQRLIVDAKETLMSIMFQWTQSRGCQWQRNVDEYKCTMNATQPKVDCQCQRNVDGVLMNAIQGLAMPTKRCRYVTKFWWMQPRRRNVEGGIPQIGSVPDR